MTPSSPVSSRYWLPLFLLLTVLAAALWGEPATRLLRYDREAVLGGELWRLLTGHLVHLGWPHTLMNVLAAVLIFGLFGRDLDITTWLVAGLGAVLAIDLGLLWLDPDVLWYVGLSGVLHGLIAAAAVVLLARGQRGIAVILLLLAAKLAWEQFLGPLPGSEETAGGPVLTEAHLYGAAGGLLAGWFSRLGPHR